MSLIPELPILVPGVMPPSRETWETIQTIVLYLPVFTAVQWLSSWYPMGKTSIQSRLNLPGKFAWVTMESVTLIVMGYIARTLPREVGLEGFSSLPGTNKLLVGLYIIHYLQRAILSPIWLNPSMAPIHFVPWSSAIFFNYLNATQIGGWLCGYGITDNRDWAGSRIRIQVGLMIFCLGFFSNIFHDDELREIRRRAIWEQEQKAKKNEKTGEPAERVYKVPQNLLFNYILYPHYVSEWLEWAGYWMIGGSRFAAARNFVVFEVAAMAPRAIQGKQWYINKFGKENVGDKKALIPFIGP